MKRFRVKLVVESEFGPDKDPALSTEIEADDEMQALSNAKKLMAAKHPNVNFMKTWCWHIEALGQHVA